MKSEGMKIERAFLDTSFFIRLLNSDDPHHEHAIGYFKRMLKDGTVLISSTIVAAEYGIVSPVTDLPLRLVQFQSFDIAHAKQTSVFARTAFDARKKGALELEHRVMIPNDTKLIAQADLSKVDFVLGRDKNFSTLSTFLQGKNLISLKYLDITTSPRDFYGELFD